MTMPETNATTAARGALPDPFVEEATSALSELRQAGWIVFSAFVDLLNPARVRGSGEEEISRLEDLKRRAVDFIEYNKALAIPLPDDDEEGKKSAALTDQKVPDDDDSLARDVLCIDIPGMENSEFSCDKEDGVVAEEPSRDASGNRTFVDDEGRLWFVIDSDDDDEEEGPENEVPVNGDDKEDDAVIRQPPEAVIVDYTKRFCRDTKLIPGFTLTDEGEYVVPSLDDLYGVMTITRRMVRRLLKHATDGKRALLVEEKDPKTQRELAQGRYKIADDGRYLVPTVNDILTVVSATEKVLDKMRRHDCEEGKKSATLDEEDKSDERADVVKLANFNVTSHGKVGERVLKFRGSVNIDELQRDFVGCYCNPQPKAV